MKRTLQPGKQGLYDPRHEHDACGVGFVVDLKGRKSHEIVEKAIQVLLNLQHRGACGCEENTGDGAGVLMQMPHAFLEQECDKLGVKLPAYEEYGAGSAPREARGAEVGTTIALGSATLTVNGSLDASSCSRTAKGARSDRT